jgi:hypothetical protein
MDQERIRITFIGHNENGLIGFINGTTELLYLERPRNWEALVEKYKLPYIKHADVHAVNLKNYREEDKNAESPKKKKQGRKRSEK